MMFIIDIAFSLELIALIFGAALLIYAVKHTELGMALPKFIAYLVMILAILSMLCTGYYTVKYLIGGYFEQPIPMGRMMMKSGSVQKCNMMGNMKNGMMGNMPMMGNQTQMTKAPMQNGMMKNRSPMMEQQSMPVKNKMMNQTSQMTSSPNRSSRGNGHTAHHPKQ